MAIKVGEFNKRIKIVENLIVGDNQGGGIATPTVRATVWAKAKQLSGERAEMYNQDSNVLVYEFTLRHYELTSEYTIRYDSKDFRINEITNIKEQDRFLRIIASVKG